MKATEANLLKFLRKSPQFVIPIYQRNYSWTEAQCQQLWSDLLRAGRDDNINGHFIGSIVYVERGLSTVTTQEALLVIDGQQRLTTSTLLIAALAEHFDAKQLAELLDSFSARKLRNYYLLNPDEDGERHYKLILSETDKDTLLAILKKAPLPLEASSRIRQNYELDRDGRIWWGSDGGNMPRLKRFLSDVKDGRVPQTLWTYQEVGHTQEAKKELIATVAFPNSDVVFETPKPTRLLRRILQLATAPGDAREADGFIGVKDMSANYTVSTQATALDQPPPDIVLDFFAGTGSTMDAVFQQNAEDKGNRRCILVQLPEPLPGAESAGWTSVADITKGRLRGAGKKVREATPGFAGDLGFRVFKLDTSNIRAWNPNPDDLKATLFDHLDHIEPGRSADDILYEILLKLGLDLCVPIEQKTIAGKPVHSVGGGVLMACLAESIQVTEVEELALGIAAWRKAQGTVGETTAVFRDSAFQNDVAKSNLAAILEQHGIKQVRSL